MPRSQNDEPGCGILAGMPRPRTERQAWEDERAAIHTQIAALEQERATAPAPGHERLTWQIRRLEQRRAELDARLGHAEPHHDHR